VRPSVEIEQELHFLRFEARVRSIVCRSRNAVLVASRMDVGAFSGRPSDIRKSRRRSTDTMLSRRFEIFRPRGRAHRAYRNRFGCARSDALGPQDRARDPVEASLAPLSARGLVEPGVDQAERQRVEKRAGPGPGAC
jgi:hypothetical protein